MNGRAELWERYRRFLCVCESVGMSVDVSRMMFADDYLPSMKPRLERALEGMAELECGAIANPDEKRQVGHYWLRAVELAPDPRVRVAISRTVEDIKRFAAEIHAGQRRSQRGKAFRHLLLAGIGGSALGPQFVSKALGSAADPVQFHCCDNTDPDGFDDTLGRLDGQLDETLVVVVSKSGGTVETRNAMLEVARRYDSDGLSFPLHAVAVTQEGSALDLRCEHEGWLARFPMWDWVGGRTSQTSAVGLLPACLQGFDIDALLEGAREMDVLTRKREVRANPAALLAAMWHYATEGAGRKDMVIIPYKDRLSLLASYLQQLVMESLGKETDLDGRVVHQGLTVFGNKGSTDQHAYVQQLREGVDNFFVTFVGVRRDRQGPSMEVEPDVTSGDYLHGFLLGTRQALYEKGRESISITLERVDARSVGAMIALFERAVGLYASLINVNAYHQPGVEAGKKAAASIIELQRAVLVALRARAGEAVTVEEIAAGAEAADRVEDVYHIVEHLAANPDRGVVKNPGASSSSTTYAIHSG